MKTILSTNQITKFIMLVVISITFMVQAYAFLPNAKRQTNLTRPVVTVKSEHHREIIVLIHGLMRSSMSMSSLKSFLEKHGYQVYSYSYPSAKYTIHDHGIYLNQFIENLLVENPGVKIHFITHSLGGIIIREALSKLTQSKLKNIGYLIMLAPPNQGSFLAKLSVKIFPILAFAIKPLAELSSDQGAYVHRVPVPNIKIGIIAGRFDAKVPPSAVRLKGQIDTIVINATHTFIMNHSKTRQSIINYLEKGTFEE